MGDLNNVFPLSIDRSVVRSEVKNECHIPTKSVEGRERERESQSSSSSFFSLGGFRLSKGANHFKEGDSINFSGEFLLELSLNSIICEFRGRMEFSLF